MKNLTDAEVLAKNPQLDAVRIQRYEALVNRLATAGVNLTPRYELASVAAIPAAARR